MKLKMLKKPQLDDCIPKCVWMTNLIGNKYYLLMFEIVRYIDILRLTYFQYPVQHLMVKNHQRDNNTYIGNKDMVIPARIRIVSA